jgi:effector-binding domain-containing protein
MTDIRIVDLAPQSGAGIDIATPRGALVAAIRQGFDRLYASGALAPGHGHNFILYHSGTPAEVRMTVGVLDRAPGGADADVKPVQVPGGRTITAEHRGDYGLMKTTYDALHSEVKARGLKLSPVSLEIYGDWSDDPAKVYTDLYLYLGVAI